MINLWSEIKSKLKVGTNNYLSITNRSSQISKISCPSRVRGKASEASKGELIFKAQSFLLKTSFKKAFTLVEIIVVITIIAIL
jgi:prepilin-type N-terminal cleavage/methylation domain-containing protein